MSFKENLLIYMESKIMNYKKPIIVICLVLFTIIGFSQKKVPNDTQTNITKNDTQTNITKNDTVEVSKPQQIYPYYIMPNNTKIVGSSIDTLWVLRHPQLVKTVIVKKKLEKADKQILLQKVQINTLKEQVAEHDSLKSIITEDRDLYISNWNECKTDLQTMGNKNIRQKKMTRIVTIVGITTTVVAFFAGGYFLQFP